MSGERAADVIEDLLDEVDRLKKARFSDISNAIAVEAGKLPLPRVPGNPPPMLNHDDIERIAGKQEKQDD